ncbi:MAG: polynucleotide adenylyltransferase PcnB, partial [Planctomycetes bacterium]|nr:polynucleotide adenylyltransferase PcnB [Planctomycetota bacterium]
MTQVARWYSKLFGSSKPLLGVVHVAPLPGTPRSRLPFARVAARALQDARSYLDAGLHGVIVENFGDAPFACGRAEPHTIACLTRIAAAIKEIAGARPVGVNVLRNDAAGALGVALAAELDFIRVNVLTGAAVTDQGLIQGDAAALLRYRRALRARVAIFADVRVKHATQLRAAPVALQVNELLERALADAVLVTGAATGSPPAARHVREVKPAAVESVRRRAAEGNDAVQSRLYRETGQPMESEPYRIAEPLIVPASLDPDAVKIIRRLQRYGHEAYLVGGCVRDLSLGRMPKDFDVATSARPRQVKRLFRNSRIIGRRFKLVHIQFGRKIIEVSTFRRKPGEDIPEEFVAEQEAPDGPVDDGPIDDAEEEGHDDLLIRRDNVFGSAEEDALRRDFTINALFYDVADNVVLDYVGGTDDLEQRTIRTIGDPRIRFQEDPVRILRAMRFAARLDFSIDPAAYDAMIDYHADLEKCAAPRLTEELLRLLSCGNSRRAWELLDRTGSLDVVLPEIGAFLDDNPDLEGWRGHVYDQLIRYFEVVDDIDRGRRTLANAVLLTVLLIGPIRQRLADLHGSRDPGHAVDDVLRPFCARMSISRRDAFRVKQIIIAQPRFRVQGASRRRRRIKPSEMVRREYFKDSLDFFRIEAEALGLNRDELSRWTNLHYEYLRETDPDEYQRAMVEAPFGHAVLESAEREGAPAARRETAAKPAAAARGRGRRGTRASERPPACPEDEEESAAPRRAARSAPAREPRAPARAALREELPPPSAGAEEPR